jgi:hypothetical protein
MKTCATIPEIDLAWRLLRSPSPRPSPQGEGGPFAVSLENPRLDLRRGAPKSQTQPMAFLLPKGEGQDEGEGVYRQPSRVLLV